ncbi:MAG: tyrosine-type recombinase/integrase [Gaiellaceae bacterium]
MFSVHDGKKIRKSFATEAAARQWRADATSAVRRGAMRSPSPTTVRDAFEAFVAGARTGSVRTKAGAVYKPSVIRRWDGAMRVRRDGVSLLHEIGGLRLADVDRNRLQAVVEAMLDLKLDPSTIRNTINALRPVFRRAVARGELQINPTIGLEIPSAKGRRLRVADPAEAELLIGNVQARDRAVWATAFYAGLRLGELQALGWECVDLAAGVIRIEASWDAHDRQVIDVKSTAGHRRVPIAALLREQLLDHKLASGGPTTGLVFGREAELPFLGNNVHSRSVTAWKRTSVKRLAGLEEQLGREPTDAEAASVTLDLDRLPRGPAHVRIAHDRRRRQRQGDLDLHGSRIGEYHARPLRPPDAE